MPARTPAKLPPGAVQPPSPVDPTIDSATAMIHCMLLDIAGNLKFGHVQKAHDYAVMAADVTEILQNYLYFRNATCRKRLEKFMQKVTAAL